MGLAAWQSFLPEHVVRSLVRPEALHLAGSEQRFDAVVLFTDVSGFTAISEALAKVGRSGAEELTRLLNAYFEPMIELIHSYGGIIGRFGGDAMTVLFSYDGDTRVEAMCRAIQCALEMQVKMQGYAAIQTTAGVFGLAMKSGLAAGPTCTVIVGTPASRLEYFIAGDVLGWAAEAEHQAASGQVFLHESLSPVEHLLVLEAGQEEGGFRRVIGLNCPVSPKPLPEIPGLPGEVEELIQAFLHRSIAERVRDGQIQFINEHRKVTVLFVAFGGFEDIFEPGMGERLQGTFLQVFEIVERYGGYLNKIDAGDKGNKYIVLFGAPIAYEDCESRALRCALDLRALDVPVRVGVNTGSVFSGQVGSWQRQEYTVMGDAVNLSARLMQAAKPGQILVSQWTRREVADEFHWGDRQLLQVKGKAGGIEVFSLERERRRGSLSFQEIRYELPMVGRQKELELARKTGKRVLESGQGRILGLTAEAGMGKSRLAAEMVKLLTADGWIPYGGECLSHGTTTSYLAWQPLLRSFFGIDPALSHDLQVQKLAHELNQMDPALAGRLPLLGAALNLDLPDNDITAGMDAKLRKASREGLIVECLRHRALQEPLLVIIEDAHWIDPLSNDLLETVARNSVDVPVLLLVIYRPPEMERIQPRVTHFPHFTELRLTEFTTEEARQAIALKLKQVFEGIDPAQLTIPGEIVERITERAHGNPFFIDEMVNWIRDQGLLSPVDLEKPEYLAKRLVELGNFDLPDSLRNLIISRIDRLDEDVKVTLKVASVVGRLFRASWLWGVYPGLGEPVRIVQHLDALSRLDITPLDKPAPELEYLFKHIITRDVAYESLAVATRTMLHGQVGDYFEDKYEALNFRVDYLAYHYGLSDREDKKRHYFRLAAAAARESYANEAALDYYQRLLPLLSEAEQLAVLLEIGLVLKLTGQWGEAEQTFRQGLASLEKELPGGDPFLYTRFKRELGVLIYQKGDYAEALPLLEEARQAFEALGTMKEVAETLTEIGVVHWYQGDFAKAQAQFEQARVIAESVGDRRVMYRAVGNMGAILSYQGDFKGALAAYDLGESIAAELGDRMSLGIIAGNRGTALLEIGDTMGAFRSYVRYLQFSSEIGYLQGVGIAVGNLGEIYLEHGEINNGLACYALNLKISRDLGDQFGISFALWNIGRGFIEQGRYEQAGEVLQGTIELARNMDIPYELSEYLYDLARLRKLQGAYTEALALVEEAISQAEEVERGALVYEARVLCAWLKAHAGKCSTEEAIRELEALLENPESEPGKALAYEALYALGGMEEHLASASQAYLALYEATPRLFYRQKVESLAGLSLPVPSPLPPLPDVVTRSQVSLEQLLSNSSFIPK